MNRRVLSLALAALMAVSLVPATAGAGLMYEIGEEFPVALQPNGQIQPDIDYPWIVWKDNRDCEESEEDSDIYAFNFETGEEVQVSSHEGPESNPSISGDWVVYSHDSDGDGDCGVYAYNLATEEEKLLIEVDDVAIGNPAIEGNIVVHNFWDDRDVYDGDIWAYDLETDESWAINPEPTMHQYEPEIGDGWVVYRQVPHGWGVYSLAAYNLDTGEEVLIGEGHHNPGSPYDWSQYGDGSADDGKIVYQYRAWDGSEYTYRIEMYDCETEEVTVLSTVETEGQRRHPVINDGLVTWHDDRVGVYEVYGYDLAAGEEMLIVPAVWEEYPEGADASPDASGEWVSYAGRTTTADGIVAWHDRRDEGNGDEDWEDLYAMFLWDPSSRDFSGYEALAGSNRFSTAVEVSKMTFPDGADTAIIATGMNFPDALAASSLAGLYSAPILLVSDVVPEIVAVELERLGASEAVIVGGPAAVPASVAGELSALDLDVRRIGGTTRFTTANMIAKELVDVLGPAYGGTAFVATGYDYPDALSAGPLASFSGSPIFLGGPEGVSGDTKAMMDTLGVTDAYVLGGPSVISLGDVDGVKTTALAGADRYETAAVVAEFGYSEMGLSFAPLALATGEAFPDALSAGAAQGVLGGSLLITPSTALDPAIADVIEAHSDEIPYVGYIGGLTALNQSVRDAVDAILGLE